MTDYIELGPELFSDSEETVISWKGSNFYRACDRWVTEKLEGGSTHCVKRINHPSDMHEDYHGNQRSEIVDESKIQPGTEQELYGDNPETITIPIPAIGEDNETGELIHITRADVEKAWDVYVRSKQHMKRGMDDETRTVAAVLRAINAALPEEITNGN